MSILAGLMTLVLVLIVPLTLGVVLIVKSRSSGLGYPACGNCRYDVRQTVGTSALCPECGAALLEVGVLAPGGRRNRPMLWGGIVLAAIPFTCAGFSGLSLLSTQSALSRARQNAATAQAQAAAAAAQAQTAGTASQPATTAPDDQP